MGKKLLGKQENNMVAKKLNLALEMLQSGRAPMAMSLFEELAEGGNFLAINILGDYYRYGWGCETDYKKAVEFYGKASTGECGEACFNLGEMYEGGDGVKKNYKKAFESYEKSIECGYNRGFLGLARLYYFGKGVKKDLKKYFEYVQRCADGGDILATYDIGWAYEYGEGVERNLNSAIEWFSVAADQGYYEDACIELSKLYQDASTDKYNTKLSFYYAKRASELGSAQGDYFLSMFYASGDVVQQDKNKFLELINKAINNGCLDAAYFLGRAYLNGDCGLTVNIDNAIKYLYMVSEQEVGGWSDYYLGKIYSDEDLNKINYRKARYYFERFIEKSVFSEGFYELGLLYYYGLGKKKNLQIAFKYFQKGVKRGCPYCMAAYGGFYEDEKGFPKKPHLAYKWYKKSMERGCDIGYCAVMSCYAFGIGVKQNLKKVRQMGDFAIEKGILEKSVVENIYNEGKRKAKFKKKVMK